MSHGVKHDNELAEILAKEAGMHIHYFKQMAVRLARKLGIELPKHGRKPCGNW